MIVITIRLLLAVFGIVYVFLSTRNMLNLSLLLISEAKRKLLILVNGCENQIIQGQDLSFSVREVLTLLRSLCKCPCKNVCRPQRIRYRIGLERNKRRIELLLAENCNCRKSPMKNSQ